MIIPDDDSLTLDPSDDELVLDHSDRPAPTLDDVLAMLPGWAREDVAPIRDALLQAYGAQANHAWAHIGQTVEQLASPRLAEGRWLDDEWGALLQRPRAPSESDGDYRARLLATPLILTPNAIENAVRAIVERFTQTPIELAEPAVDEIFFAPADPNSGCPWTAFWQSTTQRLWADYPESLNRTVGARWTYANSVPEFWIAIPGGDDVGCMYFSSAGLDLTGASDALIDFWGAVPTPSAWGAADERFFALSDGTVADQVLVDVESRRMCGVRWMLFIDPLLGAAL